MRTRTDHSAGDVGTGARSTRRDGHTRTKAAARVRDRHEVKPAAAERSDARELTRQPARDEITAPSGVAPFLLLAVAYAGMATFFLQLILGS